MKILHTSDWHLGRGINNYSLIDEQSAFIEFFCQSVIKHNIDIVFLSGDVFDTSVSNADAIKLYSKAVTFLTENGVKLILISGNHDGAARLSQFSDVVKKSGAYLLCDLDNCLLPITITKDGQSIDIFGLPYFNLEQARTLLNDENIINYNAAFSGIVKAMLKNKRNAQAFLLSHCFVTGAVISESDNSARVGTANAVSQGVFDGFSYVALGHLHSPQNVSKTIRYSGSPLKYSFSESAHKKSMTVIDSQTLETYEIYIKMKNDIIVLKGTFDEVLKQAKNISGTTDYVKLTIIDRDSVFGLHEVFREHIVNLCGINIERDLIETQYAFRNIEKLSGGELLKSFFEEVVKKPLAPRHYEIFESAIDEYEKGVHEKQ